MYPWRSSTLTNRPCSLRKLLLPRIKPRLVKHRDHHLQDRSTFRTERSLKKWGPHRGQRNTCQLLRDGAMAPCLIKAAARICQRMFIRRRVSDSWYSKVTAHLLCLVEHLSLRKVHLWLQMQSFSVESVGLESCPRKLYRIKCVRRRWAPHWWTWQLLGLMRSEKLKCWVRSIVALVRDQQLLWRDTETTYKKSKRKYQPQRYHRSKHSQWGDSSLSHLWHQPTYSNKCLHSTKKIPLSG